MILSCDFETTTKAPVSVWIWGAHDVESDFFMHGETVTSFIEWCFSQKENVTAYFHNLKFDGSFVIYWLLHNGYTWKEETKDCEDFTFTTLITDNNLFYNITIYYRKSKKKTKKLTLIDSAKLFPNFSVESIAKSFDLPIKKGCIDYDRHNKPCEITKEEIDYLHNDCEIVASALLQMFQMKLTKNTIGSCSLTNYKEYIGEKKFRDFFPLLEVENDLKIRRAYKGGWTFLNPDYALQDVGEGVVYDINSLYPWVMSYCLLPHGIPVSFEGEYIPSKDYPLYVQNISVKFRLKKNHLPTVQIKNSRFFKGTEYLTDSSNSIVDLTLTNLDLELLKKHYHIDYIQYNGGYAFQAKNNLFRGFIEYWTNLKIQAEKDGNKGLRTLCKLVMNNLYGKFSTFPACQSRKPELNIETDTLTFKLLEEKPRKNVYIPVGVFVTAWARYTIINNAQKIHEESILKTGKSRFIYADTDSLHLTGFEAPKTLDIDSYRLGAFKEESKFYKGRFIRAKRYIEYELQKPPTENGIYKIVNTSLGAKFVSEDFTSYPPKITCCGLPSKCYSQVTFINFKVGTVYKNKLQMKNVQGGIMLVNTDFTLN